MGAIRDILSKGPAIIPGMLAGVGMAAGVVEIAGATAPLWWWALPVVAAVSEGLSWISQAKHGKAADEMKTLVEESARDLGKLEHGLNEMLIRNGLTLDTLPEEAKDNPLAKCLLLLLGSQDQIQGLLARDSALAAEVHREFDRRLPELLEIAKFNTEQLRSVQVYLRAMTAKLNEIGRNVKPVAPPLPKTNFPSAAVSRNPDFVDRPDQLNDIAQALTKSQTVALTHALSGEGGVGKTELAAEFAFRHAGDFDGLWWVNASRETLEPALARLVADLGEPPGPQTSPDDIRRAIYRLLAAGRHLVILDNIDSPEALHSLSFPESCRALVTTRLARLLPSRQMIDVPVLTRAQSVELLTRDRLDLRVDDHTPALEKVAAQLGDHALAVKLAAAFLRNYLITPDELLERLKKAEVGDPKHPLERLDDTEAGRYGKKVAASLSLLFGELRCEACMPVLAACSLLAPEAIPAELLGEVVTFNAETTDEALAELSSLSILDLALDAGGHREVSVHRLTQSVVRGRTEPGALDQLRAALIAALLGHMDDMPNYQRWGEHDRFISHAEAVAERMVGAAGDIPETTSEPLAVLLGRVAWAHENRLRFGEAIAWYSRAEAVGRAVLGDTSPELAIILSNFGDFLRAIGRLDAALDRLRDAERIFRAAFGDDHPLVAVSVNNIGGVLKAKGDMDGALAAYRDAERVDRAAFGDDHPNVAIRVNNIGSVLRAKGDLDGALAAHRDAERIDRAAFGDDHPEVATDVNNIGQVLDAKNDLDGALAAYRDAERIDRAAFGDDHPKVAIRVNNIGSVLKSKGDLEGALAAFRDAERIDRAAFGDDHPMVAIRVNNIGSVLKAKGDLDSALTAYREAERIDRAAFGDDHPNVAVSVNNIGSVLKARGDRDGARRYQEQAFRILLRAFGPRGEHVVPVALNLMTLEVDPFPIAEQIAGPETAAALRTACMEELARIEAGPPDPPAP
jgi:tetratricopeptide (TPR) repeat protein